ncbi:hypothetical protein IB644_08300 [Allofrancisella guangzhouensis]|nr:hypothetical protein [Allofrancisella guangzhouensis]MBK2046539.1 hypothetical protein [Allofrancisella guangzhouensis]
MKIISLKDTQSYDKNTVFTVYGVNIDSVGNVKYYINENTGDFLFPCDNEDFKIKDSRISKTWSLILNDDGSCDFIPYEWKNWTEQNKNIEDYDFFRTLMEYYDSPAHIIYRKYKKLMDEEFDTSLIKTEKLGRLLKGEYKRYFIKIYDDSKISGGYLLSLYKTLPQNGSDVDEWFDNYEELEKYFKNNDLEVEWLEE